MSGVMNPGRRDTGLLSTVMKGVQIARDLYGIKVDDEKLDMMRAEQEQQKANAAAVKAEKDRLASGRYREGERGELMAKGGYVPAKAGEEGAFQLGSEAESGLPFHVKKYREPKIAPSTDTVAQGRLKLDRERFEWAKEQAAAAGKTPQGGPPAAATYDQRLSALNTAERQRFDSASMGLNAVSNMAEALEGGSSTFSVFGDNDFTMARSHFEDALGRMQSGGAINSDEAARFRKMAPTLADNSDIQKKKLQGLYTEMALRVQNLGFDPAEVLDRRASVAAKAPVRPKADTAGQAFGASDADSSGIPPVGDIEAEMARRGLKKNRGAQGGW